MSMSLNVQNAISNPVQHELVFFKETLLVNVSHLPLCPSVTGTW